MLKKGQGDHTQHGVVMQAMAAPPLEMIEPEFLLRLLVPLFSDPARLDPGGQNLQSCVGRQISSPASAGW
ncbi:hypothetical protein GAY31_02190 [Azospirillum brasilense]|nr:hypothetical protein [Azospirillum brasilense]